MPRPDQMTTCKVCNELKYPDQMKQLSNGYLLNSCKDCYNEQQRKTRASDKERFKAYRNSYKDKVKNRKLQTKYGITHEEFNRKQLLQLNGCAICKQEFKDREKICVDHNHETNKVRDLLCYRCNFVLGLVHEDEDLIWDMLEYLKRHNVFSEKKLA